MRIHCDVCGAELDEADASVEESDDGEVLEHFCSDECQQKGRSIIEPFHGYGVDDERSSP